MLSYAFKRFHTISNALKRLHTLTYAYIRLHTLTYAYICLYTLSNAFICFYYACIRFYTLLHAFTCIEPKVSQEQQEDRGSLVYRLYLRKPVKKSSSTLRICNSDRSDFLYNVTIVTCLSLTFVAVFSLKVTSTNWLQAHFNLISWLALNIRECCLT